VTVTGVTPKISTFKECGCSDDITRRVIVTFTHL